MVVEKLFSMVILSTSHIDTELTAFPGGLWGVTEKHWCECSPVGHGFVWPQLLGFPSCSQRECTFSLTMPFSHSIVSHRSFYINGIHIFYLVWHLRKISWYTDGSSGCGEKMSLQNNMEKESRDKLKYWNNLHKFDPQIFWTLKKLGIQEYKTTLYHPFSSWDHKDSASWIFLTCWEVGNHLRTRFSLTTGGALTPFITS